METLSEIPIVRAYTGVDLERDLHGKNAANALMREQMAFIHSRRNIPVPKSNNENRQHSDKNNIVTTPGAKVVNLKKLASKFRIHKS